MRSLSLATLGSLVLSGSAAAGFVDEVKAMAPPSWMLELACYLVLVLAVAFLYCIVFSPAYRASSQASRRQRRDAERVERIRKWAQVFPRKWRKHRQNRQHQQSRQLTEDIELQTQPTPAVPAAAVQMHGGSGVPLQTSESQSHDLEDPRQCWYPEEYPPVQPGLQHPHAQQHGCQA